MRAHAFIGSGVLAFGLSAIGCAGVSSKPEEPLRTTVAPGPALEPATKSVTPPEAEAQPIFRTFAIYTDRVPRHAHYAPSGYMGDSDLTLSGAYIQTPNGNQGPCVRVSYKAEGAKGWSGLYWQDPANNWGDNPGKAGYDLRGAKKISFWARGEKGGERIQEFRIGGILGQYPDSDAARLKNVKLSRDWKKYSIDLSNKDLRHIIGGFGFMVLKAENPGGMTFYLDDILYEGPDGAVVPEESAASPTPLAGQPVAVSTPAAPAAPPPMVAPAVSSPDMDVKQTETGLRVSFSSRVLFASGKSVLSEGSPKILNQLVTLLNAYPTNRVLIEGHTDSTGNADFNMKLSELRGQTIRDYLMKQGGYEAQRFEVVGYGATRPVADNNTSAGRLLNRRVEVTILKGTP